MTFVLAVFAGGLVAALVKRLMSAVGLAPVDRALGAAFGLWREGDEAWRTVLFSTLVFAQLAMALSVRSEEESLLRTGLLTNKPMLLAIVVTIALQLVLIYWRPAQLVFGTMALTPRDLGLSFGLGMLVLIIVEVWKAVARSRRR